jgi:hypothetical protein
VGTESFDESTSPAQSAHRGTFGGGQGYGGRPSREAGGLVSSTPREHDASLLDICDNVLNKGVVLSGDVTIGLAQVDLIYARLSLLLCAADRVLPNEETDFLARHHARHVKRGLMRGRGAK